MSGGPAVAARATPHSARRAALDGLLAFAAAAALGQAIAWAGYAITGAYRPWTWVKVGFLYLASFCGVTVRAGGPDPFTPGGDVSVDLRIPLLTGTALAGWLLVRAGRRAARAGRRRTPVGVLTAAVAFAVPTTLCALPATLRFPGPGFEVSVVWWQAVVAPVVLGIVFAGAGAAIHLRIGTPTVRAAAAGGWTAFLSALVLAFVGFLVVAAVKPSAVRAYARGLEGRGTAGGVTFVHHVLALPNQSVYLLAPAMGASTELGVGDRQAQVTLDEVRYAREVPGLIGAEPGRRRTSVPLGGGYLAFLLVPAVATILGGQRAARGARTSRERAARGAGAGIVFALLVTAASVFTRAIVPTLFAGLLPVSISTAMPATALLALAWGVGGGLVGGAVPSRGDRRSSGHAGEPAEPDDPSPTSTK